MKARLMTWAVRLSLVLAVWAGWAPRAGAVLSEYAAIDDSKDRGWRDPCQGGSGGMPVWWVSEPYINVWISDVPLWYRTSRGEPFLFRLTYKQRDARPDPNNLTNECAMALTGWNQSWSSFIHVVYADLGCQGSACKFSTATITLHLGEGGVVDFLPGSATERYDAATGLKLQEVVPGSGAASQWETWDTGANGLRVTHRDGAQDIYGFSTRVWTPYPAPSYSDYLLTRHIDPHGNTTWLNYEYVGGGPARYRVKSVVDCDHRTNRLSYNASGMLAAITNAYGLSAQFTYDAHTNLTGIVDAAGLSTTLSYDTNGWPTALITPYGTNQFAYTLNSTNEGGNFGGDNLVNRAVAVREPGGGTHLYLYRNGSPFLPTNYPAGDVPANTPLGTLDSGSGGTNAAAGVNYRNSFYWTPRQSAGLSTTNLENLTVNDYARGRQRHWLQDSNELYVSDLLSVERAPSPDGVAEGLKVFYDYEGKMFPCRVGAGALPAVKAWRLPDGETHYEYWRFDDWGHGTNQVTTYTGLDGGVATRTNQFIWVLNTYTNVYGPLDNGGVVNPATNTFAIADLLVQVIGPDGEPLWTAGGYEPVTWTNDFPFGAQTNRNLLLAQRVVPRSVTNAANGVTALTFGNFDRIASLRFPAGLTVTNLYDGGGFLWRSIGQEIGRTNTYAYTTNGLVRALTNGLGLAVNATWDPLNRLTGLGFPDGSTISNVYDRLYPGATKDRLGRWTTYSYDGLQHLTTLTDARTNVTQLGWCDCGALDSITDPLTNSTSLFYNNQGLLTNILFADGSIVAYIRDTLGRVTLALDGTNRWLSYGYNNQGLVTTVSNAYGLVQRVRYDALDRPVQVTDANNVIVTNQFDLLNRLITRTWPDGISEGFGWANTGLVTYTNRNGKVTRFARDVAGRVTAVTNANQEVTQLAHNCLGQVTDLWDGRTNHTVWHYNEYGWLTNKLDALNHEVLRLTRDSSGQVTNRWTPQFGDTAYLRDPNGNVTNISYPSSSNPSIQFVYDALNRLQTMVDAVGTNTFGYTAAGQLQSEDGPWSNDTLTYGYTQGQRTSLSLNSQPSALNLTYGYDWAWRLYTLSSPAGSFNYAYDAQRSTLPTTLTLPNAASITNHYDSLSRLDFTALVNKWGHVLDGYSYTHDAVGLRTNIVRDLGLTTSTVSVGYDQIGQLVSWAAKETNATPRLNEQLGFGFDQAGNLRYRTNGGLIQTFTCDSVNEVTSVTRNTTMTVSGNTPAPATNVTVNGVSAQVYGDFTFARTNVPLSDPNNTFTIVAQNAYGVSVTNTINSTLPSTINCLWDSNGNLTNDGTRAFAYDAEYQLTNVTVPGVSRSDFTYDGLGRRRIARNYTNSSGTWNLQSETHYLYDGYQLIQERDGNNDVLVTYTRGIDLSGSLAGAGGIGGLLARTDTNGSTFYHADGAGNITGLIDGNQSMAARYLYGAFGRLTGKWGPMADVNEMQFSSIPVHRQSGLSLYPFRGYDPGLQRWLNPDPIGERGGINLYGFVGNNPLTWIDPLGLDNQYNMAAGNNAPPSMALTAPVNQPQLTEAHSTGGDDAMVMLMSFLPGGDPLALLMLPGILREQIDNAIYHGDTKEGQDAQKLLAVQVGLIILSKKCPSSVGEGRAIVRRFLSKADAKAARRGGIAYAPSGGGISTTTTSIEPVNPNTIREMTGARNADYYIDIDITGKERLDTITKQGHADIKVREDIQPSDVIGGGRVRRSQASRIDNE